MRKPIRKTNLAGYKDRPMFEKLNSIIYAHLRQNTDLRKSPTKKLSKKGTFLSKKSTLTSGDISPFRVPDSPLKKKLTNISREGSLRKEFLKKGSGSYYHQDLLAYLDKREQSYSPPR